MQPTATQRLIVEMLCKIYKKLEITDSYDPDVVSRAMGSGDYWVISSKYDIRDVDSDIPPHVDAVVNTLDMFECLRKAFVEFDDEQRKAVSDIGLGDTIEFPGYDVESEAEYSRAAHYLVNDLNRFTSLQLSVGIKSDYPLVPVYARMLDVFLPIRANVGDRILALEEVIEVLKAAIHPNNR